MDDTLPNRGRKIRVVIADDHEALRKSLLQLLESEPDVEVVGEACDGQEAVERALQTQPDVMVMDLSMPHCNGVDATKAMQQELPQVRVVGLSMYTGEAMAEMMLRAGASAYLAKDAPYEELVAAIRGE